MHTLFISSFLSLLVFFLVPVSWLSSYISQLWALPLTGVLAVRGIGLDFFTVYKYSSFVVLFSVSLPRQQFSCHCSSSSRDLNSSFHLNYFIIINLIFPLYLFRNFTVSSISLFMFILCTSFFLLRFYHLLSVIFLPFLEELLFRHNLTQPHLNSTSTNIGNFWITAKLSC